MTMATTPPRPDEVDLPNPQETPPPEPDRIDPAESDPIETDTAVLGSPPAPPKIRRAFDADDIDSLKQNPSDEDAKLDIALDESFPTSDPPANTQPGKGLDPAPSSGFRDQ
jgi:hypothetical protein